MEKSTATAGFGNRAGSLRFLFVLKPPFWEPARGAKNKKIEKKLKKKPKRACNYF
jgi:hypothetical protein